MIGDNLGNGSDWNQSGGAPCQSCLELRFCLGDLVRGVPEGFLARRTWLEVYLKSHFSGGKEDQKNGEEKEEFE